MACFYPLDAWQTFEGEIHFYARGTSGKRGAKAPNYRRELTLPCGRCIGCKLDRSKQWTMRLVHEAQLHERTAFITLTYDDNRLELGGSTPDGVDPPPDPLTRTSDPPRGGPPSAKTRRRTESLACHSEDTRLVSLLTSGSSTRLTLKKRHAQLFLKRLRKDVNSRRGLQGKIRYYMCGEYGEKLERPHYHLALFGEDFREDRYLWRVDKDKPIYRSPTLERLWPHGNSEIGALETESAAYIASYVTKKVTGDLAHHHYRRTDENGNDYWLTPEFSLMSRRPGIGKAWFDQYHRDVYPHDYVVLKGQKQKPPRYYDELLKKLDPDGLTTIREERSERINSADNTEARLRVRETVLKARLATKQRKLEK